MGCLLFGRNLRKKVELGGIGFPVAPYRLDRAQILIGFYIQGFQFIQIKNTGA
jgi:hypothetical protein